MCTNYTAYLDRLLALLRHADEEIQVSYCGDSSPLHVLLFIQQVSCIACALQCMHTLVQYAYTCIVHCSHTCTPSLGARSTFPAQAVAGRRSRPPQAHVPKPHLLQHGGGPAEHQGGHGSPDRLPQGVPQV